MYKFVAGIAFAMVAALPAQAAVKTMTFALTGDTATTGTHGNAREFSAVASDNIYRAKVRATAWNMTATATYNSYLGAYSNGLGATSDGESGGSPDHTIDNKDRKDFILLQFDQKVSLVSGKFTTYSIDGTKDSDATIGWNNTSLAWTMKPSLDQKALNVLNTLIPVANRFTSTGGSAGGVRSLGNGSVYANIWLVGADFNRSSNNPYDGFKFGTMTVAVIPEPASWAMMIGGFGFVGAAMRRQRQRAAIA